MATDFKINQDNEGKWHLSIENGDFAKTDSLDTAVYMSLFGEKRASKSQVKSATLRRGHFSNEFSSVEGYEVGCLFWLYTEQAPLTDRTLTAIQNTVDNGLKWLIEDKIVTKINVQVNKIGTSRVQIEVDLINEFNGENKYYNLFVNLIN